MDHVYYDAAEKALANFTGSDDLDQDTVELVGNCMYEACQVIPNWRYFNDILEKASTYVRADMNDLELQDFVGELEEQLEASDLL